MSRDGSLLSEVLGRDWPWPEVIESTKRPITALHGRRASNAGLYWLMHKSDEK